MASYQLRLTDTRKRKLENLEDAAGENTRSKAIDTAADYYLKMRGGNVAHPTGAVEQLMQRAVDQGSVTPEEIAEVLDSRQLSVRYESEWSVGDDE